MDASTAKKIKGRAPLRASQTLRAALKKRGKGVGSIGFLYSAKNDRDIVLPTDLEFVHALYLEANEAVRSYDCDVERVSAHVEGRGYKGSKPDALVTPHSGRQCLVEVKYETDKGKARSQIQAEVQAKAAESIGADWMWFTDRDAKIHERLINDWLHIEPVLHQTRWDLAAVWESVSSDVMAMANPEPITLASLRHAAGEGWPLVFAATWRLVQLGKLESDLMKHPLSPQTLMTLGARHG